MNWKKWLKRTVIGIIATIIVTGVLIYFNLIPNWDWTLILTSIVLGIIFVFILRWIYRRIKSKRESGWKFPKIRFARKPITRKDYSGLALTLFTIWIVALFSWSIFLLNTMGLQEALGFMWYTLFVLAVLSLVIGFAFLKGKKEELRRILILDADKEMYAMVLWAFLIFAFLFSGYVLILGYYTQWLSTKEFVRELILVVPAETFIFVAMLPLIMPRITKKKDKSYGWVIAQVTFALMHIPAYSTSGYMWLLVFFAFVMGIFFYQLYRMGNKKIWGGVMSVMAVHFIWNVFALSVKKVSTRPDPLFEIISMRLELIPPIELASVIIIILSIVFIFIVLRRMIKRFRSRI